MVRPPFTFERNSWGSNGSLPGRFIAGPPWPEAYPHPRRSYAASREHGVPCCPLPLDLGRRVVGRSLRPADRRPRSASRINPEGQRRARQTTPARLPVTGLHPRRQGYGLAGGPPLSPPAGLPIVPHPRAFVGNLHYRFGPVMHNANSAGSRIFTRTSWAGEKRYATKPIDNIHKMPPSAPADPVS